MLNLSDISIFENKHRLLLLSHKALMKYGCMRKGKYGYSIKSSREYYSPYDVPFLRTAFQSLLIDIAKLQLFFK